MAGVVAHPTRQPKTRARARTSRSANRPSANALVLVLVVLSMPFPVILVKFTPGSWNYDYQAILFPSDVPLAFLALAMVPRAVRRMRGGSLGALAWLGLGLSAWLAVSYLFHPS